MTTLAPLTQDNTFTLTILESMYSHETGCEFKHQPVGGVYDIKNPEIPPCTITVVSKLKHCQNGAGKLGCQGMTDYWYDGIEKMDICSGCGRRTADCWTVTPV